jgi:tRNA(Met) cytidine acetyltransferase
MIPEVARGLRDEAAGANERRLLVLAGDRDRGIDAAYDVVEAVGVSDDAVALVSTREGFRLDRVGPRGADALLGQTKQVVVVDCHEQCPPNALGRAVGAVDGGGLFVLLTPPLEEWPTRRDRFDESLAVPPATVADVTGRFRRRLVETLRTHPGVAIVSLAAESGDEPVVERDGRTSPSNAQPRSDPTPPPNPAFPAAAYDACLTADQVRAVRAFERLTEPGAAVVVESDRGRGKSSAAGLAAGALALAGTDVLVTAPSPDNVEPLFARARALVSAVDGRPNSVDGTATTVEAAAGGRVRFARPAVAVDDPVDPDVVIVDEAAALPVRLLEGVLDAPAVAFCTTVHGYEGAGRGFAVRFRDRLAASPFATRDVHLDEPIRYARGDPVESWAARALLLDARPAVTAALPAALVDEEQRSDEAPVDTADVSFRRLDPEALVADESLLQEAFGLLVAAHYRTEPNDVARLLDAPNLTARALVAGDRIVAVALLAREGGLDDETRAAMYEGERVRGNMVPDLLTSQLRDETAAEPVGLRVVRIAVHHACRGRGLGTHLLERVHAAFRDEVEYFAVGFGATPRLLRFWRRAGYRSVHLSTTRNDASGEYSAVMLRPAGDSGEALCERHAMALARRERDALSGSHSDVDVDVVRGVLAACPVEWPIELTDDAWRAVVAAAVGPGRYEVAPGAVRDLAYAALLGDEPADETTAGSTASEASLTAAQERLLVRVVLQAHDWSGVAAELGYGSTRTCMRALGTALEPLIERYGTDVADEEYDRFCE